MSQERPKFDNLDWEKLAWEKSPYDEGVFVCKIKEENYPNSKIPSYTLMALKINPGCVIDRHVHDRELNWRETITLFKGANVEILNEKGSEEILAKDQFSRTVRANEVFGIRNLGKDPLYFYSRMEPGFSGYNEIKKWEGKIN